MSLHSATFDYIKPTDAQLKSMAELRKIASVYAADLDRLLPEGPDKTFVLRAHRTNAMWANIAVTRAPDGEPRK